ncbi:MAG: VacJ family lipoprotein [Rhodobacteraceae bacterium]|nr:VacJ family lipoprotein [Paracoccaceae bacterium]
MALSACARPETSSGIYDPNERFNRKVHAVNKGIDRALLRPTSQVYGFVLPKPVRNGVENFSSNLNMPRIVVNDFLQLNVEDGVHNTFRFLINSTMGIGGLFNPARDFGLDERSSDFGETLYVWGVGEGPYHEMLFLGPGTRRQMVGIYVDIFLNPISYVLPAEYVWVPTGAAVASIIGDRYRYSGTVDAILYESADSYAQARLLYLENRRFELSGRGEDEEPEYYDPYEDLYGE